MNLVLWLKQQLGNGVAKAAQRGWIKPGHKYVRRWWDHKGNRWRYEYYEAEGPDDHRDADAVVTGLPGNRVGVATEYDPKIVKKFKDFGGRWVPERKVWAFSPQTYLEKVRPYLNRAVYDLDAVDVLRPHLKPDDLPQEAVGGEDKGPRETPTHYSDGWPKSVHMVNAMDRFGLYPQGFDESPPANLEAPVRILASVMKVRKGEAGVPEHWKDRGFFLQGKSMKSRLGVFKIAANEFLLGNGRRGERLGEIVPPGATFVDGVLILTKTPQDAAVARAIVGDKKVLTRSEELRGYEVHTPETLEAALQDPDARLNLIKHLGMVYVDGSPQEWENYPAVKELLRKVGVVFFGVSDPPEPEDLKGELAEILKMPKPLGKKMAADVLAAYSDPHSRGRFPQDLVRAGMLIRIPAEVDQAPSPESPETTPPERGQPERPQGTPDEGTASDAPRGAPLQPGLWEDIPPKAVRGRAGKPTPPQARVYQPPLFELAKALGYRPGAQLVLKAEVRNIPVGRLRWVDRPAEREKVPASHYLMPKERKFPYRNKDGSINCRLLRAAISRAAQHGYEEVERRARALYQKHCGGDKEE
ncbi:hypothetical protein KZX47_10290 [Thermus sp. SYSU G05001]|uniref:Uncharacterized protein n=1 Tax=Thermus brevis TaxID=2862456 RepID=A0ABS7A1C8_9DEIN|nr:hypothetical protein [Thermus brevis]MBW6395537.1 hypothetical protein [Thermus brevis]